MQRTPKHIVLEGIDGSGKDTQADLLCESLDNLGIDFIKITQRESSNFLNVVINKFLASKQEQSDNFNRTLGLLCLAAHTYNSNIIKSSLARGQWVIEVRNYCSTVAYGDESFIPIIERFLEDKDLCKPDLTVFLDIHPAEALFRIQDRNKTIEHYEHLEILLVVRRNYQRLITKYGRLLSRDFLTIQYEGADTIHKTIMGRLEAYG